MMMWCDKRRKPNKCWDSPVWLGNQTLSNSPPRKSRLVSEGLMLERDVARAAESARQRWRHLMAAE